MFGLSKPCHTWQVAVPPRVGVPPVADRQFGIVLVEHAAVLVVSVPHLAVPLTHTFTVDGNEIPNADVPLPHRHWHMPKLDTGEYPLALSQVTSLHGSGDKAIQLKILMHFYFNCCFLKLCTAERSRYYICNIPAFVVAAVVVVVVGS